MAGLEGVVVVTASLAAMLLAQLCSPEVKKAQDCKHIETGYKTATTDTPAMQHVLA